MEPRKLTKEDIDKVRHIEGFPIGTDESIIALSNAPYYTACPNPFIEEFVQENGKVYDEEIDDYHREPFSADVSEGKNDAIYGAHGYHTKVPYKAIMRYIFHYTNPGDIVFDGFCGTGMTGLAAQMCGTLDNDVRQYFSDVKGDNWGSRKAVLGDLSPLASYIAYNYNSFPEPDKYRRDIYSLMSEFDADLGWMYETTHIVQSEQLQIDGLSNKGKINYTVWSDVFICPTCGEEIVFMEAATAESLKDGFVCKHCNSILKKTDCQHAVISQYDEKIGAITRISKQVPVLINYTYQGKKYEKKPDVEDLDIIEKISNKNILFEYPSNPMMHKGEKWGDTWRAGVHFGITNVHQFFTKRSLMAISYLYNKINTVEQPVNHAIRFTFEQIILGMSKMARYVPTHFSQVNQYLSGTMYIGSQVVEVSPHYILDNKINNLCKRYSKYNTEKRNICISTNSCTNNQVPDNSIDYIFTDPPFGSNLMYSELNFLQEAWNGVFTNNSLEAIMSNTQGKALLEYQGIMTECFKQYYRVLKPNRWITVEFHNSQNAVWNAIRESLQVAGFIIADVRTLDKKQGSFKQIVSQGAVKQDLVISAYKPKDSFTREFNINVGNEETAWAFVRQHLTNIPVVVLKNNKIEIIAERQGYLLFDRMVAYHIMRGLAVPLNATDFYKGLDEKFLKRDGMYFLPDQVNEYDTARIVNDIEPIQFSFFVTNEKTAISWLYQQLSEEFGGAQTYAELQPKFMQEVKSVDKYEVMPELSVLLEENFLQDEKGRWYIPDVTKEGDVAKLREKNLMKEFEGYLSSKGKLKLFRSEAIRVGFSRLWKDKNYKAIVDLAERLPESTIQEDPNLLMYYDISLSRV